MNHNAEFDSLTKKDKYIVAELVMVFKKYRHLGPTRLVQLLQLAFEQEIGYTVEAKAKDEKRIHKSNT